MSRRRKRTTLLGLLRDPRRESATDQVWRSSGIGVVTGSTGDVVGPGSANDDNIATFDGTSGKLIQDSGVDISAITSAGDVDGPASSVDGRFAFFDGTTGKLLKQSALLPGTLAYLSAINGSNWLGQDLAVSDGGTGASSASGAATNLGLGTGDSPQFTAINVGHPSDTQITRSSAGVIGMAHILLSGFLSNSYFLGGYDGDTAAVGAAVSLFDGTSA